MGRSGHNLNVFLPSCLFLHLFCILSEVAQPIYCTDQMQRSLDSFFRKRSPPKSCEVEMEDREKQQRTSTVSNTVEGSQKTRRKNFLSRMEKGIHLVAVQ